MKIFAKKSNNNPVGGITNGFSGNRKNPNKDKVIDSSTTSSKIENQAILKSSQTTDEEIGSEVLGDTKENRVICDPNTAPLETDLINKKLPKELLIRIFSYLDVVDLCQCAKVSKYWNELALDGNNWQYIDLLDFQKDVTVNVVENIANRCNEFLKAIRLENCQSILDEAIDILSSTCKNIEILNLKQCVKLTDKSFVQIGANLNKIISLNLESCNIGDEGLDAISQGCPNIEAIELSWCQKLTAKSLTNFLKVVANLKHFSAKGLDIVNDAVVKELSTNCKNLLSVNLKNCKNITDEGVISIANNCPQLRHLCISHCKLLKDASLIALGQKTNDLYVLESSRCSNFTDAGFIALSKGCPNLVRLDLEECSRITDLTLQHLASNCVNLRHLTLSRCECITDEGIRQLSSSHSAAVNETLQIIELDNCPLITDVALEQLYSCHSLMQLELYDCQLITRNGIKKFQNKLPNVKVHAYFAPSVPNNNQRPSRSCSCKCCTIL